MSKEWPSTTGPAGYRVLAIYPALYRLWGRARVAMLRRWAENGATRFFRMCVWQSAEDAWTDTSLEAEYCVPRAVGCSAAAIDLRNDFGAAPRALVYWLLRAAGFPGRCPRSRAVS
eukprot:6885924-Alexandrium_andersonii.AAC.1